MDNAPPRSLYRRIKERVRLKRRLRYLWNVLQPRSGNLDQRGIVDALRKLGIEPGDSVLVHSSLSRLGIVEGGVATVVSALQAAVGSRGNLCASTIHLRVPAVEHFASDPVFDVRTSRSTMGAISEAVRTLPGAIRSIHPTHSIAALGPAAEHLTRDHHTSDRPFGPSSPYWRLAEMNGKILLLGVTLASMTNFHVVEDMMGDAFPFPVYLDPVQARVVDASGREFRMTTRIHNPVMSRLRQCDDLEGELVTRGVVRVGVVGKGRTLVVDARALNEVLADLAKKNITIYNPDGSPIRLSGDS